ncbi:ABC transporter ATP-binding protein [Streptomyces sp. NRRL F-5065]|uniref:ABC transporter ATP-binding protein n=1 Tax=Streptomyces sp. NRRL F-5065 TaxID=1463855 RepID=UPI0004C0A5CB|nr:ATP-binding cassette domain-containing protein [Streptomyces sp. NRRL F-5065]
MTLAFHECTFGYRGGDDVVRGLDLAFTSGATVLLGPNGAGKSTLLSLGASALRPRSGGVTFDGLSPWSRKQSAAYRASVAWLPQNPSFLPGMTCRQHVTYAGWLKGMAQRDASSASGEALERVGLAEQVDRKVSDLSGGQQQRVAIAQALVHRAKILLLDEPTVGLDPKQRRSFLQLVASLRNETQVIVSTHDIADISEVFSDVVVLYEGKVLFNGSVPSFLDHSGTQGHSGRAAEDAYTAVLEGGTR